jgi:hypothetical protein
MNAKLFVELWQSLKTQEESAKAKRLSLENDFLDINYVGMQSGTVKLEGTPMSVVFRLDHKVDGDKLQTLAAEAGLEEHLPALFRWKPELNIKAWEATDRTITDKLAQAITTKPAKPSFKINNKKED